MTSQELADFIEQTIREARSRIEGIGDEQYSFGSEQKFERYENGEYVENITRRKENKAMKLVYRDNVLATH